MRAVRFMLVVALVALASALEEQVVRRHGHLQEVPVRQLVGDRPAEVEVGFLAHRFADFERYLGADHPVTIAALGGREPEAAARAMLDSSVLADGAATPSASRPGN